MVKGFMAFVAALFVLVAFAQRASALELLSYKDSASSVTVLDAASVEKAWASASPVCLKDGAKILGVNAKFKELRLGYGDCSNSAAKKRIHGAQGFNVTVLKLGELPADMIKAIASRK